MSRCFPYVYRGAGSGILREGFLLESTKLQKVSEKTPKDSKKGKDKKVKKERSKEEEHGKSSTTGNTIKKRSYDESSLYISKDCSATPVDDTFEFLERSSVTEERCLPSSLPNPYDSDKSQDSSKRSKTAAAAATISLPRHGGKGLHLRLKLSKPPEADTPSGNPDIPSTSGRAETASTRASSVRSNCNVAKPLETQNLRCFSSRSDSTTDNKTSQKLPAADINGRPPKVRRKQRRADKMASRYEDLLNNWAPPPLLLDQRGVEEEDMSWLSGSLSPPTMPVKPFRINDGPPADAPASNIMGTLQQRATYLHEINAYVLPYVIPY